MSESPSSTSLSSILEQATSLLQQRRWRDALSLLNQVLSSQAALENQSKPEAAPAFAQVHLFRANLLRDFRQPGALDAYQTALNLLQDLPSPDHEVTNLLANVWTNQGIAMLDGPDAETLQKSLHSFDQAIELRSHLPLDTSPFYPWGLAAAWMNRADALMRLDPKKHQQDALAAHEKALQTLNLMPEGSHPSLPARRALALMNCALLSLDGSRENVLQASQRLADAIAICQSAPPPSQQECMRVMIGIQLNRGILLMQEDPKQSWHDAKAVLALTAPLERQEILTAEAALKARHLLCQSLTLMPPQILVDDWISEATDAVDDGLALVREWPPGGRQPLMGLHYELFRFGLLIYRIWQPHFLSEFILENVDAEHQPDGMAGDSIMHQLALESIWSAVVQVNQRVNQASAEERARLLPIIEQLQTTESRLQKLRESHAQTPAPTTTSTLNAL